MTDTSTLNRLRMANPVPRVPELDAPELFAQITSLPGDARARPAPATGKGRRRFLATVVAAVVLALLAFTAYAGSNWIGAPAVKPKVTRSEYRHAQHQLTLPPRVTWPQYHIPSDTVTSPGAGGGHAVGVAQSAWECYWVHAISSGDRAAQERARTELEALLDDNVIVAPNGASENWTPPNPPATPYAIWADDGGMQHVRAMYAAAAAGHPAELIQSCRVNSPG